MWYVYIVRCQDNSLYTGITTDIERRVFEHNFSKVVSHKVKTVEFSQRFLKDQRKKKKKGGDQSEWDDGFTEKRGFVI